MLDRRPFWVVATLAVGVLVGACSTVAPGGPTGAPTDAATGEPTASAVPTATPAQPAPTPTLVATPTDATLAEPTPTAVSPDYDYDYDYSPRTPPPAGGATVSAISYGEIGAYLAGPTQMALYTFDNDERDRSSCVEECAEAWPPLTVEAGEQPRGGAGVDGLLGTIERDDGSLQVTYDGMPLYYFVGDDELYDVTGDGLNGVWHLARP